MATAVQEVTGGRDHGPVIQAEEERDASLRGTEIVTVGTWGESIIVDEWGIEIFSLASAI